MFDCIPENLKDSWSSNDNQPLNGRREVVLGKLDDLFEVFKSLGVKMPCAEALQITHDSELFGSFSSSSLILVDPNPVGIPFPSPNAVAKQFFL